jgi:hypothetical protein
MDTDPHVKLTANIAAEWRHPNPKARQPNAKLTANIAAAWRHPKGLDLLTALVYIGFRRAPFDANHFDASLRSFASRHARPVFVGFRRLPSDAKYCATLDYPRVLYLVARTFCANAIELRNDR